MNLSIFHAGHVGCKQLVGVCVWIKGRGDEDQVCVNRWILFSLKRATLVGHFRGVTNGTVCSAFPLLKHKKPLVSHASEREAGGERLAAHPADHTRFVWTSRPARTRGSILQTPISTVWVRVRATTANATVWTDSSELEDIIRRRPLAFYYVRREVTTAF